MATFKVCVKPERKRKDGFNQVFIRVTHNRKVAYISTDKIVNDRGLCKSEVTDPFVLQSCMAKIVQWVDKLNRVDSAQWTIREVVEYIKSNENDLSFSEYARKHYERMVNSGHERNARNYMWAIQHLEKYAGTEDVKFSQLTSSFINSWIISLQSTRRAKEMYPVCIRQIFKAAMIECNDEERGVIPIKFNPWMRVKIPKADTPEQLAISPEECRNFFTAAIPYSKYKEPLAELGHDVALMIFCLAGINTIDLYNLKREDYYDGIIHYHRAKTQNSRSDRAYMEMRVHPILHDVFAKYRASESETDGYLFNFHKRHSTSDSFSANVNIGIRQICESMGMDRDKCYCCYTFRHTWGTIAQNDCGASLSEVGFGLNHSSHRVTRGYVKIDYTPAWELNDKVIELVFFTQEKGGRQHEQEETFARFSSKNLMRGEAFYKGELLGMIEDIGFSNIDQMVNLLSQNIDPTLSGQKILYRITNVDRGTFRILCKILSL